MNWVSLEASTGGKISGGSSVSASALHFPAPPHSAYAVLAAPRGDGYIPRQTIKDLNQHWAGSELRWLPGGHASLWMFGKSQLAAAVKAAFVRFEQQRRAPSASGTSYFDGCPLSAVGYQLHETALAHLNRDSVEARPRHGLVGQGLAIHLHGPLGDQPPGLRSSSSPDRRRAEPPEDRQDHRPARQTPGSHRVLRRV